MTQIELYDQGYATDVTHDGTWNTTGLSSSNIGECDGMTTHSETGNDLPVELIVEYTLGISGITRPVKNLQVDFTYDFAGIAGIGLQTRLQIDYDIGDGYVNIYDEFVPSTRDNNFAPPNFETISTNTITINEHVETLNIRISLVHGMEDFTITCVRTNCYMGWDWQIAGTKPGKVADVSIFDIDEIMGVE